MFFFVRPFVDLACFVWSLLPRKAVRWLGAGIGVLWYDVLGLRKKVILDNLKTAFPEWSEETRARVARKSLRIQGSNFAEVFTLPSMDANWLAKHVVFEGWENLEAARAKNKGVYLLGMHIGNGDVTASAIVMKGAPIDLISKFFKNKTFNDMWFHIRAAHGVRFIEPHGEKTAFEILRAIKNKSCVAFVLDQFMGRPYGIPTTFFGRRTGTAYGLAVFVLKTGSPVVPVYSYEGSDDKIHIVFEPALDLIPLIGEDKDENLSRLTQKFNDVTEAVVRAHPEEWIWMHRRWKDIE